MAITLSTDGYCELADVQALLQQYTIDSNSNPSSTQVENFIKQDFGEINAILRSTGYSAPVPQQGGQLASGGTINLKNKANLMDTVLTLKANTGSLTGSVRRGDFIIIAGDNQRYMITSDDIVNSDGEITVEISLGVEVENNADTQVTYTAVNDGAKIFKTLNALMTAIRVQNSAYSSVAQGVDELTDPLIVERDRIIKNIQDGRYDIPSAEVESVAGGGTMYLLRS
ncbi:MAG: hypothetical protein CMC15_14685 [Flavobacteriaceae bacterium]|nr:hypothetical protein [Flavobacteriaceae bacterium]|tara:strand:+ start:3751 stop:4431 length:681 start_codon:yes stop_codon:yes gene_type:complete